MCISFHPELPSVIAGGTFGGQVVVWQTNESLENSILASSQTDELSHEEPVSSVSWIPGKKSGEFNVCSSD
jgi:WD40 repeat protein